MNRLLHLQCTKRYLRRSCTNSSLFMKNNNNIENKKRMPNYIFDKKSYNKKVLNNPINKHKQYHLPSLSIVNNFNCHQKRLFSKTTVKQKKSGGNDDNFDEQEMAQLLKSLEEDKETEELREMKFPGVQRGEKMVIIFTCTVCNTRTGKTISKLAYEENVSEPLKNKKRNANLRLINFFKFIQVLMLEIGSHLLSIYYLLIT